MIPVAGSAYTYTYATMGELCAWIIGWDLILEYLVGTAAVAVGWAGYMNSFLTDAFGFSLPKSISTPTFKWVEKTASLSRNSGSYINLTSMVIIMAITTILMTGTRESARFNTVVVTIKLIVILVFIFASLKYVDTSLWHPFIVPADKDGVYGHYGITGVLKGSSIIFFAYIGFDSVSTAAQESKNPQRDMPLGILASLIISTTLYIIVSLVLVGLVPYKELDVSHPISLGIEKTGIKWLAAIVDLGAVAGLTSIIMISLLAQSRVFYSMSKDGLIPPIFSKINSKTGTPWLTQIVLCCISSLLAGFLPSNFLGELTSIGTLFAFFLTNLGVMILRIKSPDLPRRFKVPFGPYVIPLTGAGSSLALIFLSSNATLLRLFVWLCIGILVYFFYGRHNSVLNSDNKEREKFNSEVNTDELNMKAFKDLIETENVTNLETFKERNKTEFQLKLKTIEQEKTLGTI